MMRTVILPVLAAAALLVPAAAQDAKVTPTIGVVDFVKLFEAYKPAIDGVKVLEEHKKRLLAELDEQELRIRQLQTQRDTFQQGSLDYARKSAEMRALVDLRKSQGDICEAEMQQKRDEFENSMYEVFERAIAVVAKDNKVQLVLRAANRFDGPLTPAQQNRVYQGRQVWYTGDEIDLTPKVITLLQAGGVPPAPAAPAAGGAGAAAADGKGKTGDARSADAKASDSKPADTKQK